ncbi:MAG: hypothetical protein FJ301_11215 [Planctomycetes bacterium]|nr:hypothetical protein [Planctomycetota bacterium]
MHVIAVAAVCALLSAMLAAQAKDAGKEASKGLPKPDCPDGRLDAFYVGHSLAYQIPDVVAALFAARKGDGGKLDFRFREQHVVGASLGAQIDQRNKPAAQRAAQEPTFMGFWFDELPKGGWDALVLIDSVPRSKPEMPETLDGALTLAKALIEKSPKGRVCVYEPWHCIHSGTEAGCMYDRGPTMKLPWRERLVADAPMWDGLVADLQKALPKTRCALIPAGRALGMAVAAAESGTLDGFAGVKDFFEDDIHLNPYGKWFVGLVHYAVLAGDSPLGLPIDVKDRWGRALFDGPDHRGIATKSPSAAAQKRLQEIAWAAVQGNPDPGAGKGKKKAAGK